MKEGVTHVSNQIHKKLTDDTHFVMKNGRAERPSHVQDDLALWYDMKGKTNTDTHNDFLLDLSGNNRHGSLQNFAFQKGSGYKDGLVFDGIDDSLTRPAIDMIEPVSGSRNMLPYMELGGVVWASGNNYNATDRMRSPLIPARKGTVFHYSEDGVAHKVAFYEYDENQNAINPTMNSFSSYTVQYENTKYIKIIRTAITDVSDVNKKVQLEEGSTPTPYTPYIPSAKMTYQLNGNILSYDEGGIVRRVQNGQVVERKGINILPNSNFFNGADKWSSFGVASLKTFGNTITYTPTERYGRISYNLPDFASRKGNVFYYKAEVKNKSGTILYLNDGKGQIGGSVIKTSPDGFKTVEAIMATHPEATTIHLKFQDNQIDSWEKTTVKNAQLIDLTATYGPGNEPTLEEIQAEPDKWAWTPNPLDLIESTQLKGNILGDMEDIIDDLVKDEQSGTEIYTDKADDSVVHVDIDGKSYQNAGSGKNLFNLHTIPKTVMSSLLLTNITTNSFTVESTNTNSWQSIVWDLSSEVLPGKTYTLKLPFSILSGDIPDTYGQLNLDGSFLGNMIKRDDHFLLSFNTTGLVKGQSKLEFTLQVNGYVNVSTKKIKFYNIQLEEGSTATEYEPPAPTPDYPIEIHSLNNVDVVSSVGKANLWNLINVSSHEPYNVIENSSTIELTTRIVRDTPNATNLALKHGSTVYEQGKSYTVSGYIEKNEERIDNDFFRSPLVNRNEFTQINKYVDEETGYFSMTLYCNQHFSFLIHCNINALPGDVIVFKKLKIEEGVEDTKYTPRLEDVPYDTQTQGVYKTNITLDEPLRSVGDVKDRLFRDSDGLWKVERNVGEWTLNGSENWAYEGVSNSYYTSLSGKLSRDENSTSSQQPILSSHFKPVYWSVQIPPVGSFRLGGLTNIVVNHDNGVGGVVEFRRWVQNNPFTILGQLSSLRIETLSQDIQDKLNNLRSFEQSNYVYTVVDKSSISPSVADNLKPTLHATFLPADWYKENLMVNSLKIYNRALQNEELLLNYRTEKERWGM